MDLPLPAGEAWSVIQGNDDATGSHSGLASFCWDLMVADQPQNGSYPAGSNGAPFYACAVGNVITVLQSGTSGTGNIPNIVEVQQAPSEICGYLHVQQNGAAVAVNDQVPKGRRLGMTGDTGANVGAFHVHLAVTDKPDRTSGFVTFPVAFSDYEIRTGATWHSVARGIPTAGQVIRNPPTPVFSQHGLGITSAIARDPDHLDLVVTDSGGRLWTARWAPGAFAANWDRWRPVLNTVSSPGTPASVVARAPTKLDVFAAGLDGRTWTAAWDADRVSSQWRGWWNVLSGWLPPGGAVTAISRDPAKLDIFLVSNDGGIYTAAWDRNVANQAWRGWWRIGTLTAKPGAPVTVVSRAPTKLDIFVAGDDGLTYTAAWDANQANGQWRGWWNILAGRIPRAGTISAVSRDPGKLDIFLVSTDGGIYTAAWDRNMANQVWRGWWRIGGLTAPPGAPVSCVARTPDLLDIFVAADDGKTYSAAWDPNQANGQWRGWWNILTGAITPGGAIAAVSRASGKLDIFLVSVDNAVYTAAWDASQANGQWRGWWRIG
jgi:Peptidase family M23